MEDPDLFAKGQNLKKVQVALEDSFVEIGKLAGGDTVRDPASDRIWQWGLSEQFLLWITPIFSMTIIMPEVIFLSTNPNEQFNGVSYNSLREDVGLPTM